MDVVTLLMWVCYLGALLWRTRWKYLWASLSELFFGITMVLFQGFVVLWSVL